MQGQRWFEFMGTDSSYCQYQTKDIPGISPNPFIGISLVQVFGVTDMSKHHLDILDNTIAQRFMTCQELGDDSQLCPRCITGITLDNVINLLRWGFHIQQQPETLSSIWLLQIPRHESIAGSAVATQVVPVLPLQSSTEPQANTCR